MKIITILATGAALALWSSHASAQCASPTPDAGEIVDSGSGNNDFCTDGSLPLICEGTFNGYYVETDQATSTYIDEDFWTIDVPDGETIQIDILFSTALADTDLFLYDANVHDPCSALTTNLGQGFSTSDNEQVIWTNTTGSTVTTIIRVNIWEGSSGLQNCNTYDMTIDVTGGASSYCGQDSANSVSSGAILTAEPGTAANTTFTVSCLPPNEMGVLFVADQQSNIPWGCGTQCADGLTFRFPTSVTGSGTVVFDEVVPSGLNNAQYWYRDPDYFGTCGDTFNFSDAVVVP